MDRPNSPVALHEKTVFTTGEAAELCRVSQQTIIRCFDNGRLQGFRVPGSRFRRIPRAELIRFMRENDIPLGAMGETRHTILLVDSDPEIIRRVGEALGADSAWSLVGATNALEAGLALEQNGPDIALFDVTLPGLEPESTCRKLQAHARFSDLRMIFTGGAGDEERLAVARRCGAEVLRKPFEFEALRGMLRNGTSR